MVTAAVVFLADIASAHYDLIGRLFHGWIFLPRRLWLVWYENRHELVHMRRWKGVRARNAFDVLLGG